MTMMKCIRLGLLVLLMSQGVEARVFNFKNQSVASYLRGAYGLNKLQKTAYAPGYPTAVTFPDSDGVNQDYAGEIGFSVTSTVTMRFGVELLYPQRTTGLAGKTSTGTQLLSLDSQIFGVIPQFNLEIPLKGAQTWKTYLGVGVGYAYATIKNSYSINSTGQAVMNLTDYIEEGTGWGIMGQGSLGIEFAMVDNISLSLEAGYRYLSINNYKANRDALTPAGQLRTGGSIVNYDGSNRVTDFSGYFAAATFRFYIF